LLSQATFFLCLIGIAHWGVFLVGGSAAIFRAATVKDCSPRFPPAKPYARLLFASLLTVFFLIYFVNALAPEVSPDWKQLLLAGSVFAIPAYFNTGARFLIPGLVF
jgi:hypothetical protein